MTPSEQVASPVGTVRSVAFSLFLAAGPCIADESASAATQQATAGAVRQIRTRAKEVYACYLRSEPDRPASLRVEYVIAPGGNVDDVISVYSTLTPAAQSCALDLMRRWKLEPTHSDGNLRFRYLWRFRPKHPTPELERKERIARELIRRNSGALEACVAKAAGKKCQHVLLRLRVDGSGNVVAADAIDGDAPDVVATCIVASIRSLRFVEATDLDSEVGINLAPRVEILD